jgi:hypothetical protein
MHSQVATDNFNLRNCIFYCNSVAISNTISFDKLPGDTRTALSKVVYFVMEFSDLPIDVVKLIIQYCPYGQWFRLSKELSTLASQVISPLNCRSCWAHRCSIEQNWAKQLASQHGHKETVEILLKDDRVDPSEYNNYAIRWASYYGHKEIVEMLLQDSRVDPCCQ